MKLWLLTTWYGEEPKYDTAYGFVVRAITEEQAREFAAAACGDEGKDEWLTLATCVELTPNGPLGIILQDFHAG